MSGPSGVDSGRLWSDYGPWSCVVGRVRRSVLVSLWPLVPRNRGTGCGSRRFRAARSFKIGAAPGSAYVQPRIGWYLWLYSMCIVARRDFVFPWSV